MTTDRRRWIRHTPDPGTVCDVTIPGVATVRARRVVDLSVGGSAIEMDIALRPGQRIDLELAHPPSGASSRRAACVAHCRRMNGAHYRLGAAFGAELPASEVDALCPQGPGPALPP
jgi:hypothetical protein